MKRYAFQMENENIKGRWVGYFTEKNGRTILRFTEAVKVKKFYLRPFLKNYLKRQQLQYITDLRRKAET